MRRDPNASRPTSVNFLPDWYRRRRRGRRLLRYQLLALIGILLLFGWLIGQQLRQRTNLAHRHERIREQLESVRRQTDGLSKLRESHRQLVQSLRVQHRLHRPIGYAEIAATLVDLVPESVSLRRLRMQADQHTVQDTPNPSGESGGSNGTSDSRNGSTKRTRPVVTLQIEGIGPSDAEVSRFTGALAASPLFGDVEIGYWRQAEHDGLRTRRFAVRTTVPLDRRYQPPADEPSEMTDAR